LNSALRRNLHELDLGAIAIQPRTSQHTDVPHIASSRHRVIASSRHRVIAWHQPGTTLRFQVRCAAKLTVRE